MDLYVKIRDTYLVDLGPFTEISINEAEGYWWLTGSTFEVPNSIILGAFDMEWKADDAMTRLTTALLEGENIAIIEDLIADVPDDIMREIRRKMAPEDEGDGKDGNTGQNGTDDGPCRHDPSRN